MQNNFNISRLILLAICLLSGIVANAQFTEEKKISDDDMAYENQMMRLHVINEEMEETSETAVDIEIQGLDPRDPVVFEDVVDTTIQIPAYRRYTVTAVKEDFMFYSERFWPEEKKIHVQDITLKKLAPGLKSDVPGIIFLGSETEIYHKSAVALQNLYDFLVKNPEVTIAVNGHVNDPDNLYSEKFLEKASRERAQAVIDFLVNKGIDESRMTAVGKGATEMKYPDPKTDWENEENRRVEIEILSL
ncbi:OmpA family protein [Halocola ammonii]